MTKSRNLASLASGTANALYLGGTSSVNLLDDYEEGFWTPVLNSGTLVVALGSYVKVGDIVTCTANWAGPSDITTATGVEISGLPFTCRNGDFYQAHGNVMFKFVTTLGNGLSMLVTDNTAIAKVYQNNAAGTWAQVDFSDFGNATSSGTGMRFTITYSTA